MLTKDLLRKPVIVIPGIVLIYLLIFPTDIAAVISPIGLLLNSIGAALAKVLALSGAVSAWLYVLLGILVISRTATGIWGKKSQS